MSCLTSLISLELLAPMLRNRDRSSNGESDSQQKVVQPDELIAQLRERIVILEQENSALWADLKACQRSPAATERVMELEKAYAVLQTQLAERHRCEQELQEQVVIAQEQKKAAQDQVAELAQAKEKLARANEEILEREQEKAMLLSISEAIATVRDKEELFTVLMEQIKPVIGFDNNATIFLFDHQYQSYCFWLHRLYRPNSATPAFTDWTKQSTSVHADPLAQYLIAERKALIIEIEDAERLFPEQTGVKWAVEIGLKQALHAPLQVGGTLLGFLSFDTKREGSFTEAKLPLVQSVADQVAVAVANILANEKIIAQQAALLQAEQARSAELAKVNEALKQSLDVLATEPELEKFVGHVLKAIAHQFQSPLTEYWYHLEDTAYIALINWQGRILDRVAIAQTFPSHAGLNGFKVPPELIGCESLQQRKQEVVYDDYSTNPFVKNLAWVVVELIPRGLIKEINVPLVLGDTCIGSLSIHLPRDHAFTEEQLELAQALGHQVTLAVQLTQLAEEAKQVAITREQEKAASARAAELAKINEVLQAEIALRQQVEIALRESERCFRGIFEQAAVGIAITSLDGRWLQVNQRLCDIVGYPEVELTALTFRDITHPDALAADLDAIPRLINGEIPQRQVEKQYICKDGTPVWVHLTISVAHDDTQAAAYFICVIQDITQRKEAELVSIGQQQALQRSLNLLATEPELDKFLGQVLITVTEQLGAPVADIWLDDTEQDITWLHLTSWNGHILTASEQPNHPGATPLPLCVFRHYSSWVTLHEQDEPYIYYDVPNHPELLVAFRDWAAARGGIQMLLLVPLVFGDTHLGTLAIGHQQNPPPSPKELELAKALAQQVVLALQLTRLAKEVRQAALLEERNRLAGEIHDTLAQAFTGISIQLGVAKRISHQDPDEVQTILNRVDKLAQAGLREARRSVWALHPSAVEYTNLAHSLSRCVEQITNGTNVRVEFRVQGTPSDLPAIIGMNLLHIGQEALVNALKHAHPQTVWLELTFESQSVCLCVRDDGRGFTLPSNSNNVSGGFGLVSMQQRAERIGAQLTISSRLEHGTEVLVQSLMFEGIQP